jgi:NADH:ubiquinone oxidoreductase subunit 4 (subunit M)
MNYHLSYFESRFLFVLIFSIEFFLIIAFLSLDLLTFYIFFESILIPMLLIIAIWGSRQEKIKASYYFLIYTLIGSFLMLWAMFVLFSEYGSLNIISLLYINLEKKKQLILWFSFFIAFSIKIPMFPLHI